MHFYELLKELEPENKTYPALKFEKLFGLKNIGRNHQMPNGETMKEMEDNLWSKKLIPLENDFQKLSQTKQSALCETLSTYVYEFKINNPELQSVTVDYNNYTSLRGFVHGVVSGFNPNDIKAFLNHGCDIEEVMKLKMRILKEFNTLPKKSAFPQALRKTFNQIAEKTDADLSIESTISMVNWIPSKATIQNIHQQLDRKNYRPTPDSSEPSFN